MSDDQPDPAGSWAPPTPVETWDPYAPPTPEPGNTSTAYVAPPIGSPWAPEPRRSPLFGLLVGLAILVLVAVPAAVIVLLLTTVPQSSQDASSDHQPTPVFTPRDPTAPPATAPQGAAGDTLTTEHGVSITVEAPSCYSFQAGSPGDVERRCSVPVDVVNDGPEQIKVSASDFDLFFDDTRYTPNAEDSLFFGVPRASWLDPATAGMVLLWFDVALEGEPTSLVYQRLYSVDTALTVEFVPPPTAAPPPPVSDTVAPIGSTLEAPVLTEEGVLAVTVHSLECGLAEAPAEDGPITAEGQFCRVEATVQNNLLDTTKVSGADFTLIAGEKRFTTASPANRFDGQRRSAFIEPGGSADCTVWFDVPAGTAPTAVHYVTYWGTGVTFTVG